MAPKKLSPAAEAFCAAEAATLQLAETRRRRLVAQHQQRQQRNGQEIGKESTPATTPTTVVAVSTCEPDDFSKTSSTAGTINATRTSVDSRSGPVRKRKQQSTERDSPEEQSHAKDGPVLKRAALSSAGRPVSDSLGRRLGGKAPKHPWSHDEDEKLVSLIIEHGANRWAKIAQHIPGRVGKQCRERWQNHLDPDVNRATEWSEDEEAALFKWHKTLGNKWADIATHLPGRTDNSVKNYYHKRVGQLKRGEPASRPKEPIEKSTVKPTLSAPERAQIALRAKRNSMPDGAGANVSLPLTASLETSVESGRENLDVTTPSPRNAANSAQPHRPPLADSSVSTEKTEIPDHIIDLPVGKGDHILQPSSLNIDSDSSSCEDSNVDSPIPVSVCRQRVRGAPPPKTFPCMSGVRRTSKDTRTMKFVLPAAYHPICA